jgi:hypothetical protein
MMIRLLSRTLMTTPLLVAIASASAFAQTAGGTFDPAQMPEIHGVVAQYDLAPRGDVDGLILTDGTEVHVAPYLGPQLLQGVKPGDDVTIHGLRARVIPLVQAMSVTDDKTGRTIADTMLVGGPPPHPHAHPPGPPSGQSVQIHDTVKVQLHGPRGEFNGVLLTNGTIVHMPPPAATRLADLLVPGTAIAVAGDEVSSDQGRAVAATAIGPANGALQPIMMAPPMGVGPTGAPPPPPPAPDAMGGPPASPPPGGAPLPTPPQAP